MSDQCRALRRVQFASNQAADEIYKPLADDAAALVVQHAERQADGSAQVTAPTRLLALARSNA